MDKIVDSIK